MGLFALQQAIPAKCGPAVVSERPRSKVLGKPGGRIGDFCDYALNAYVGCGFGCSYCYAAFFVADEAMRQAWGTWVDVKTAALEEIELCPNLKGKRVTMSTATDPYQPLEARIGLTRQLVEAMSHPLRQPKLVIQTRSPLVVRDIDLFKRFEHLRVNMSITTDCDEIRKEFEPGCSSIERRMEAIRELRAAGIKTGVTVSPMLPVKDPHAFGRTLAELGADRYAVSDFHQTDRPFAASTRDRARALLRQHHWTRNEYERAAYVIRGYLPSNDAFSSD